MAASSQAYAYHVEFHASAPRRVENRAPNGGFSLKAFLLGYVNTPINIIRKGGERRRRGGRLGGLRTEDGGWRMEDGGWRMEDGGWKMEDGGWRKDGH